MRRVHRRAARASIAVAAISTVVTLAASCSETPNPTFELGLTFSDLSDGGRALTDSGALLYQPGGPFTAKVTISGSASVSSATPPTRATLFIDEPVLPTNATGSATATLLAQDDGTFSGSAPLAWPPGGPVHVRVVAAGASLERVATLDRPLLNILGGKPVQVGTQESLQFCVESSSLSGTVAVHLDHAVFAGGAAADTTQALAPGDCALEDISAPSLGWTVYSHALFTAIPALDPLKPPPTVVTAFQVTAALQQATPPAPPTATAELDVTPLAPVIVSITSPAPGHFFPAGTLVPLQVMATYGTAPPGPAANISVSFQSAPSASVVPATIVTDAAGQASTSLLLPNLGGGTLLVQPTGGNVSNGVTLSNNPIALSVTAPVAGTAVPTGTAVTLQTAATFVNTGLGAPNVNVTYQMVPSVGVVPASMLTDSAGHATSTFVMPALGGGTLFVQPIGGATNAGITLTN